MRLLAQLSFVGLVGLGLGFVLGMLYALWVHRALFRDRRVCPWQTHGILNGGLLP